MTLTYGFYDSSSSDRIYNAKQFGSIFDGIIEDGVYAGIGDKFMVVEDSPVSMDVIVGTGRAWFNHTWTLSDATISKTLATADALLNRIDVVYLEVNEDAGTRANKIDVLTGTPASSPVAPTLTNTASIHQYPLAHVYVGAAVTSVSQANITNYVGTTSTPFVAGIIDYVTTNEIVAQWEAEWDDWFQDIIDQLSSEAETNLQNQIWDLAGVASGAPPYADDMVTLSTHDHSGGNHPQIPTAGIENLAVTAAKIASGTITGTQLASSAVSESKIASGAVTQSKIGSLAVGSSQIANNAIISSKIADGAIDNLAYIANNLIDDTKVGNRVPQFYRRKGGNSTNWNSPGSTTYTPGAVRMQGGSHEWTGTAAQSGNFQINFPEAFSGIPIVIGCAAHSSGRITASPGVVSTTSVTFYWQSTDYTLTWDTVRVYWFAIGPE